MVRLDSGVGLLPVVGATVPAAIELPAGVYEVQVALPRGHTQQRVAVQAVLRCLCVVTTLHFR